MILPKLVALLTCARKSQIALEYAYRRKLKVPECSIFWVYAGIIVRFEESYKRIAREFGLPERDDPLVDVLQLVRDFLEHQCNMSWLMIVDNVDDSQIFRNMRTGKSPFEYIPQVANGSVLYTSRNRDVAVDLAGDPITVPPMSGQEARMLLGDRTRGISTEAEQDALIAELDQLPLAITQAASYMNKRRKTIPQYLKLLQHGEPSRLKLLAHDFLGVGRETAPYNSVTMTWFISFQQIKSESPRAADLLSLMSFLDRQSKYCVSSKFVRLIGFLGSKMSPAVFRLKLFPKINLSTQSMHFHANTIKVCQRHS